MYQHIMSVVSLSNISIKRNFTQLTRVELPNVYNTSMETTFCAWCHVICCGSFPNVTFLFKHCLSLLYNRPTTLFNLEKCGPDKLNLCHWRCIIWMNEHYNVAMLMLFSYMCFPTYKLYDKVVRQRMCRAILLSPQRGDTTSCIRHSIFVNFKAHRI